MIVLFFEMYFSYIYPDVLPTDSSMNSSTCLPKSIPFFFFQMAHRVRLMLFKEHGYRTIHWGMNNLPGVTLLMGN